MRKERRMRVFVNSGLRRIFWSKKVGLTVEWRKLQSEELIDIYSTPNILLVIQ